MSTNSYRLGWKKTNYFSVKTKKKRKKKYYCLFAVSKMFAKKRFFLWDLFLFPSSTKWFEKHTREQNMKPGFRSTLLSYRKDIESRQIVEKKKKKRTCHIRAALFFSIVGTHKISRSENENKHLWRNIHQIAPDCKFNVKFITCLFKKKIVIKQVLKALTEARNEFNT